MQIKLTIKGADEVVRELLQVGPDAQDALRQRAYGVAKELARRMVRAATAQGRQAARGASTVEALRAGIWPEIRATNTGRAKGLLFGSNFGMLRHSGWYARGRYHDSSSRQFRPWIGGGGADYWFRATAEREQAWVTSEWGGKARDDVVQKWSA